MASALDNRFFNTIRDTPMSTLDGPSPTRVAPINFGLGQDNWDRKTNIWQMTPRTFDYIANGDKLKASLTRDNKHNTPDLSKIVARAPSGIDHNITSTTSDRLENPPVSARQNRPIGPLISPTRLRSNGILNTQITDTTMRSFGQASLLSGSAPDIEPTRSSSSSSSSTVAKHHGPSTGQSFRHFNVEDAEEFVPSYLQDNAKYPPRAGYMNGIGSQPHHPMSPSVVGNNVDYSMFQARSQIHNFGSHMQTRAFGNIDRNRDPYGNVVDHDEHQPNWTNVAAYGDPQVDHVWSDESANNWTTNDRRTSNLRPDVASYEPPIRSANAISHLPYQNNSRRPNHERSVGQPRIESTYAQGSTNLYGTGANTNAFNLNAALHFLDVNDEQYQSPYSRITGSNGRHYGHRNSSELVTQYPPKVDHSSALRSRDTNNGPQSCAPIPLQSYPHGTGYGYAPGAIRVDPYENSYSIDPVTGAVIPVPDGGLIVEPETKHGPRSEVLEEFRTHHRNRKYELKDIYGYIVEFSGDQNGSRFIQTKLEQANSDEKDQIFSELQTDARQLMSDVFGNYVIQKMFDYGNQSQKKILASLMQGSVAKLSLQPYGCRCVQKAFEHILTDQQVTLIKELEGNVMGVVESQHGNHVIQKAIECIPGEHIQFIIDAHKNQIVRLSKHIYGCRIVQRMLEHCSPVVKRSILDELQYAIPSLIIDQFGNYVIQCIIRKCDAADRYRVVEHVKQQILFYSTHKFASNVVEKALVFADDAQRADMIQRLTTPAPEFKMQSPIPVLLRDQYGNYVMQTVLKTIQGPARRALADEVRYHLTFLGKLNHGKQIIAMADTVNAITAGHSPSSTSTGPHTPRTPTSLHSGGGMGTPTTTSVEVDPTGYSVRESHRNTMSFRS